MWLLGNPLFPSSSLPSPQSPLSHVRLDETEGLALGTSLKESFQGLEWKRERGTGSK